MDISTSPTGGSATRLRDILVVDDSRANLEAVGRRLTQADYRPCLCASGAEALDRLQGRSFDIVLLDMIMPQMTGVSVLQEIRSMPVTSQLPVIMVTSRGDPGAVVEALNAGADDHISKPFDFQVLVARMERLVDRARSLAELRASNIALDARIARRAIEIGELRERVADMQAERQCLLDELDRLSA